MDEAKEAFESRILRLANYLSRAYKYNKPSILFAMYLSEFLRSDVEESLKRALVEQGLEVVSVDAGNIKDLPVFFSATESNNTVFFVYNLDKSFPDALQYLNFKREELLEHHVKAVFWVREEELVHISLEAPDFFAFRNCVIEFMEVPAVEERRPALVEFALEAEYRSQDELKQSIALKEKLLSELSAEAEISGYLLGSLGVLYWQIGSYKKSLEYLEKALKITQDIGDRVNEGAMFGNIGNAHSALGQMERAIEYYEQALAIAKEIGDRRGEVYWLNNLGLVFKDMGKYDLALACYLLARKIRGEIRDPKIGTTESNINELKTKIGKREYQKLMATVEPKAEKIIRGILVGNSKI